MSENGDADGGQSHKSPLRRTFDVVCSAPIGVAVSVVEEIPELIAQGRRRLELQLGNALFVGRFVVTQKQREFSARLDDLFGNGAVPREDGIRRHDRPRAGALGSGTSGTGSRPLPPSSGERWPTTTR